VVRKPGYIGSRSDNQVKAFSLFGSDRVSRVRSDYGSGNQVRHFPYPGAIRLAWLSSSKTKTSPQVGFSLIPQPRLG
jgi:hypothetical protein